MVSGKLKVSVIVPVYNAENYISECIESLLNQSLKECEFIFINDGSKDNSQKIIESYLNKDSRIKLINQKNQGVSIARNKGLEIAKGEYVGFVDADDYIDQDMYRKMYDAVYKNSIDVVLSNFEGETDGKGIITKYSFPIDCILNKEFIDSEIMPYFIKSDNLNTVCNKLYKTILIKNFNIEFPENVPLGEDGMFNMKFFGYSNTFKYIDYCGYHYRAVDGSATRNTKDKDYFRSSLDVYFMELPDIYYQSMNIDYIQKLKAIKLIRNVINYVHVYFSPANTANFIQKYQYIKNMVNNKHVREALPIFYNESYSSLGRYEKVIIKFLKLRAIIGLYFLTTYSRFRNGSLEE